VVSGTLSNDTIVSQIGEGVDTQELLQVAYRAALVYLFMLVVIRLLGKREVGTFSAFDLMAALMLGEVVDEIIFGNVSLLKGGIAISVIAVCDALNSWSSTKSSFIRNATEGKPRLLIRHGKILHDALAGERMHEEDLYSLLRCLEIDRKEINEVKEARLEPSGELSIIKEDWAKPLQKRDLSSTEHSRGGE
jgi:uncharacterized membrane protein YcaP (DUF421 family)